ncbi:hypothetical protein K439DRAFT_1630180 [Ramaria rubella]|nr:hypothetical protein K439DRAFT_1630180 [Ramaria rubella]
MNQEYLPRVVLDRAAGALHKFLTEKGLTHAFLGGYQFSIWTNGNRQTKDLDVVVKKPLLGGFGKVLKTFAASEEYEVIRAVEGEGGPQMSIIQVRHIPTNVPVDVLIRKPPSNPLRFPLTELPGDLPFYPPKDMFIRKLECLQTRDKRSDLQDIKFLWENRRDDLDFGKIKDKVTTQSWESIMLIHGRRFPLVGEIQNALLAYN